MARSAGLVCLLLGLLVGAGCGSSASPAASSTFTQIPKALCAAASAAAGGDETAAAAGFQDVHADLHLLAADLSDSERDGDRGKAARLLEAKQVVEADLGRTFGTGGLPASALTRDLQALARVTAEVQGKAAPAACA